MFPVLFLSETYRVLTGFFFFVVLSVAFFGQVLGCPFELGATLDFFTSRLIFNPLAHLISRSLVNIS